MLNGVENKVRREGRRNDRDRERYCKFGEIEIGETSGREASSHV